MSLVQYPDSDDSDDELPAQQSTSLAQLPLSRHTHLKRKRAAPDASSPSDLPPLPAAFHDLYSANARVSTSDDPTLHGGRKRAVPHIEGNWPSHVYLEWVPSQTESDQLLRLIESVREAIEHANQKRSKPLPVPDITPSLRSPLGAPVPLHISLSRTLQIKTEDRETFHETLTSRLRRAAVRPFDIAFTTLKWVPNFDRNRWFLVLGIEKSQHDELNRLLSACNKAAQQEGHPGLYTGGHGDGPMEDNTSQANVKRTKVDNDHTDTSHTDRTDNFHISIAWNLDEPDPEWISIVQNLDVHELIKSPATPFDAVKARIGNMVHSIPLGTKTSSLGKSAGLLGLG